MKSLKQVTAIAVVVIFCPLLFNCNKLGDFLHDHPDGDIRHCSIHDIINTTLWYQDTWLSI